MLRKIRIILALLFLAGITLLLLGTGRQYWGWMASLQLLPSFLALNLPVVGGIVVLTFLLGRLYCSVICPLGVFQDAVIWLRRRFSRFMGKRQARRNARLKAQGKTLPKPRKYGKTFGFSREHIAVRFGVLLLVIVSFPFTQILLTLLAPYSAYGRMVQGLVAPLTGGSIYPALLLTAALTLAVIAFLAWTGGRSYCNNICPVGTALSIFSRFSMFRFTIDEEKCINCKRCGRQCKASCIDMDRHHIDGSRCVVCFDCIDSCNEGALRYRFVGLKPAAPAKVKGVEATTDEAVEKNASNAAKAASKAAEKPGAKASVQDEAGDTGRRNFLATAGALIGSASLASIASAQVVKRLDGGYAEVIDKKSPARTGRLVPYGALSVKHFHDHCTACQLCVSNCPNDVLRPSTSFDTFLQPQMGYEKGFCRPECTVCADICPTDAIRPIQQEQKLGISIGTAKVSFDLCFASTDRENCGNCGRHCPTGAIRMVESEKYPRPVPVIAEALCIGCGACEFLCPSRPVSAIVVNGRSVHVDRIADARI